MSKIRMFVKACDICQGTKIKSLNRPYHPKILVDYSLMESSSVDIKFIPKGFDYFKYLVTANSCNTDQMKISASYSRNTLS